MGRRWTVGDMAEWDAALKAGEPKKIKELTERLRWNTNGVTCPNCEKKAQVQEVKLSHSMMKRLWVAGNAIQTVEGGWFKSRDVYSYVNKHMDSTVSPGNFPRLVHWNIVETLPGSRDVYKITDDGWAFLSGDQLMPKSVFLYNDKFLDFHKDVISFRGAWGKKFELPQVHHPISDYAPDASKDDGVILGEEENARKRFTKKTSCI